MTDQEWIEEIGTIENPDDLLGRLVDLDDTVRGVGDPYYRDLYNAIIDRARQIGGEHDADT